MKITAELIRTLKQEFVTLDEAVFLYSSLVFSEDWGNLDEDGKRSLTVRGYLRNGLTTEKAVNLISSLVEYVKGDSSDFELLWKAWPANDEIPGIHSPSRSFKRDKSTTRLLFYECGVPAETLIRALKRDVSNRVVSSSLKTNNLTFLKNPLRWIKDKEYLNYEDELDEPESITL